MNRPSPTGKALASLAARPVVPWHREVGDRTCWRHGFFHVRNCSWMTWMTKFARFTLWLCWEKHGMFCWCKHITLLGYLPRRYQTTTWELAGDSQQKPNQIGEIRFVPMNPQSHPWVFFLIDSNVEHCAMFQGGRAEDPPKIFKDSFEGQLLQQRTAA